MSKEPTWQDIQTGTRDELQKQYKIDGRQLEISIRKNMPGATKADLEKVYKDFYDRK